MSFERLEEKIKEIRDALNIDGILAVNQTSDPHEDTQGVRDECPEGREREYRLGMLWHGP